MGDLLESKSEQRCPKCDTTNLTRVGCTPDGVRLNLLYDCNNCGYGFKVD